MQDLQNVVFRDVNKYLSAAIENEVKKQQQQHTNLRLLLSMSMTLTGKI